MCNSDFQITAADAHHFPNTCGTGTALKDGSWLLYDDHVVYEIEEDKVISGDTYIHLVLYVVSSGDVQSI